MRSQSIKISKKHKKLIIVIVIIITTGIMIGHLTLNTKAKLSYNYDKAQNAVVVYPIYTQAAYQKHGFYDYYLGTCNTSCLTVQISKSKPELASSQYGFEVMNYIGYHHITDKDISDHPEILKQYDWVIILHSEYVTQQEYDAITSHNHVLFLYPNALYALVTNHDDTITLVKGHGYQNITNAFNWKYDNHLQEYDWNCKDWKFKSISNGYELNCFPEKLITNPEFLNKIKSIT